MIREEKSQTKRYEHLTTEYYKIHVVSMQLGDFRDLRVERRREWRKRRTRTLLLEVQFLDECRVVCADGAHDHVGVPVQVLCARVPDRVHSLVQRTLSTKYKYCVRQSIDSQTSIRFLHISYR